MITIVALWRCVLVSISRRMSGWYSSSRLVECACPKHTRLCSSSIHPLPSSLFLISRTRVGGGVVVVVGQAVWVAVWPCVCSAWRGVVVVELVVSAQSSCFSPYYIGGERETSCDTPVVGIVQNAPCATTTTTTTAAAATDESSYYYCSHLLLVLLLLVFVCSCLQMGRCVCNMQQQQESTRISTVHLRRQLRQQDRVMIRRRVIVVVCACWLYSSFRAHIYREKGQSEACLKGSQRTLSLSLSLYNIYYREGKSD